MKNPRTLMAFAAVAFLWAVLAAVFGRRLLAGQDYVVLVFLSAVAGLVWLAFVNMCAGAVIKGERTALPYMATAVFGSGVSAMVTAFLQTHDIAGALELGGGITILAAVSSLLYVAVAGLPWKKA